MKTSEAGVKAICREEGCLLTAYRDVAGVWTVGYGHTGSEVKAGLTITQDQAEALLKLDLARFERAVSAAVKSAGESLRQNEFDALVSLAYNIGSAAFYNSTLVAKLNAKDFVGAAAQFTVWNRAGGVFNPGLLARRTRELLRFVGLTPAG
jgi:lysozyme